MFVMFRKFICFYVPHVDVSDCQTKIFYSDGQQRFEMYSH